MCRLRGSVFGFTVSLRPRSQVQTGSQPIRSTENLTWGMKRSNLVLLVPFVLRCTSVLAGAFPDASYTPPPDWNTAAGDPVFVLSQEYPTTDPSPSLTQPWKAIDFHVQPAAYMQAVIEYCYEGNLEVQFRGQDNATRKWYHAPWLHPGSNGKLRLALRNHCYKYDIAE